MGAQYLFRQGKKILLVARGRPRRLYKERTYLFGITLNAVQALNDADNGGRQQRDYDDEQKSRTQ